MSEQAVIQCSGLGKTFREGGLTVDQLHDAHHHTGPLTLLRVEPNAGDSCLWQPFAEDNAENPRIERNLYKNAAGNRLVFEEIAPFHLRATGQHRLKQGHVYQIRYFHSFAFRFFHTYCCLRTSL